MKMRLNKDDIIPEWTGRCKRIKQVNWEQIGGSIYPVEDVEIQSK